MEDIHSQDDGFPFYVNLPSLEEMATCSLARALFFHFSYGRRRVCTQFGILRNKHIDSMQIPSSIREKLRMSLDYTRRAFDDYAYRLSYYRTFSDRLTRHFIEQVDVDPKYCVWYPDNQIDHEKTAVKLLSSDELSEIQKFLIIASYCFEEYISTVDVNSLPENIDQKVNSDNDYLIYYWICRLKNELHKIPLENSHSLDVTMALCCDNWHMTAFKYFWNRMSNDEQISVARLLLNSQRSITCEKYGELFSMMSRDQQIMLISEISDCFMKTLFLFDDASFPQNVFWVWKHCKDAMKVEQFHSLVRNLFFTKFNNEEKLRVVVELWQTAPDILRNYTLNKMKDKVGEFLTRRDPLGFFKYDDTRTKLYEYDFCASFFKLLSIFLSAQSADFRREIMLKGVYFGVISNVRFLREIVDLCLPCADDQVRFKSSIAILPDMRCCCQSMLKNFRIEELRLKLEYFFPDSKSRQEYQRSSIDAFISKDSDLKYQHVSPEKWSNFNSFISEAYADNAALALETMKKIGSIFVIKIEPHLKYTFEELHEFIKIVESVFVGEDLRALKQKFLEFMRSSYHAGNLKPSLANWELIYQTTFFKMVPWCLDNDEEAIERFKNEYLPLDVVFEVILSTYAERFAEFHRVFYQLDEFLKWYLKDDEEMKKYKLRKINSPDELVVFKAYLSRKIRPKHVVRSISEVRIILYWFFDGDETAIREFSSKYLD